MLVDREGDVARRKGDMSIVFFQVGHLKKAVGWGFPQKQWKHLNDELNHEKSGNLEKVIYTQKPIPTPHYVQIQGIQIPVQAPRTHHPQPPINALQSVPSESVLSSSTPN